MGRLRWNSQVTRPRPSRALVWSLHLNQVHCFRRLRRASRLYRQSHLPLLENRANAVPEYAIRPTIPAPRAVRHCSISRSVSSDAPCAWASAPPRKRTREASSSDWVESCQLLLTVQQGHTRRRILLIESSSGGGSQPALLTSSGRQRPLLALRGVLRGAALFSFRPGRGLGATCRMRLRAGPRLRPRGFWRGIRVRW